VGYTSYDTVRYVYRDKLPFATAPPDDRRLPDIHLGLYTEVVVFDHATKLAYVVTWVDTGAHGSLREAYEGGQKRLAALVRRLQSSAAAAGALPPAAVTLSLSAPPPPAAASNMTKPEFLNAVATAQEHIRAGDIFQVVLSQRFERRTFADPFEVYRALRVVNPSPYMIYLQARGAIFVASSPEILCRVTGDGTVVNRPLAGTRKRGATPAEDAALATELLADAKEKAEHVMLVDLGRNDVGRVAAAGSVRVAKLMDIERYSHVMHISSTVNGALADGLTAWDALQAALPAGTVSGAPKVRAMQIIDALEPTRRGPYGGGIGIAAFTGEMDMALALRTMVVPTSNADTMYEYGGGSAGGGAGGEHGGGGGEQGGARREWVFHVQAGAGVVADSVPESEFQETVNKAAGMSRAIDLAEEAFL
jgi:anthranilate synthase component 1